MGKITSSVIENCYCIITLQERPLIFLAISFLGNFPKHWKIITFNIETPFPFLTFLWSCIVLFYAGRPVTLL